MSENAKAFPECEVIHRRHPITQPSTCAVLVMVDPELVGFRRTALTWDATRRCPRDVRATGLLHSMAVYGHS